jgi:hypothetical protein
MTSEASTTQISSEPRGLVEEIRLHGWSWTSGGVVFGLCSGIICPIVGSILTAISWVTGPKWHGFFLQRDGTLLLFLTIPLLIFGAHCLDLLDKKVEEMKKSTQLFWNRGLKNEESKAE